MKKLNEPAKAGKKGGRVTARTTDIQWTMKTWNPSVGCTRVSKGCDNCYAVKETKRLQHNPNMKGKYSGLVNQGKNHFNGTVRIHEPALRLPSTWKKPCLVFVNSMSDLFHPGFTDDQIISVLDICDAS